MKVKSFAQLNIKKSKTDRIVGDKIKIRQILNRKIIVHSYKIAPSKYGGDYLTMQIELDNQKRMVETGSNNLMEIISKATKEDFPFSTIIVEEDMRFEFT
ncbi:MAG TPA: hypothetical protein VK050_06315 [Flavobacteriaceae bacterium]|nr:hypothetical protein [Flavobacteriaceae bacterium]